MSDQDASSSSPAGGPWGGRGGYYRKTSCCLCSSSVFLKGEDSPQENEMRSLLLRTLCLQMPLTNIRVPSECSRSSFSLCESCLWLAEALLKIQNGLDILFKEKDKVLAAIRIKTEEGNRADDLTHDNGEWPSTTPMGYQIRKMILAGTQFRTISVQVVFDNAHESEGQPVNPETEAEGVQGENWENDLVVGSTCSVAPQVSATRNEENSNLEPSSSLQCGEEDGNQEADFAVDSGSPEPTTQNLLGSKKTSHLEPPSSHLGGEEVGELVETQGDEDLPGLEPILKRLKANGVKIIENAGDLALPTRKAPVRRKKSMPLTPRKSNTSKKKRQPPNPEPETDEDLFEIQLQKKKTVVDGVKMYICTRFQGSERSSKYYQCRRCPFTCKSEVKGISSPLEIMKAHVLDQHKKRLKPKKTVRFCSSSVSTGNSQVLDPSLPIYNPIIPLRRFDAAFPKRKEPKMPCLVPVSELLQPNLQMSMERGLMMPSPPPPKLQGPF